jgi:hypothetical protein
VRVTDSPESSGHAPVPKGAICAVMTCIRRRIGSGLPRNIGSGRLSRREFGQHIAILSCGAEILGLGGWILGFSGSSGTLRMLFEQRSLCWGL